MDSLSYDQLVIVCALLVMLTVLSLAAVACLLISRRRMQRCQKQLKRSLRNLSARDQGTPVLPTITKA